MLSALLLALGCGGAPSPAGPPLPFDRTGAPPPFRLEADGAALVLTPSTLAAGEEVPATFDLPVVAPDEADDGSGRAAWSWDLPFAVPEGQERFAVPGMRVFVGDREVTYDISPYAPGRTGWRVKDGRLHVVLAEALGPQGARVEHPALGAEVQRLEPAASGLAPEVFAAFTWTRGGTTRPGLLLPAPSSASWTVTIPEGARFRASPDLVEVAWRDAASDGAEIALFVDDDEVARARLVPGGVATWGGYGPVEPDWEVDLGGWAGRTVSVRLESRVRGEASHDWVFVGAPVVWGRPNAPTRRVVVVGIDTLRPDHLGAHGYERPTSPELDAFAAEAQVFDRAWAPAPRTRPSFRTATTGRRPLDAVGAETIASVFRRHGFATAGIAANVHLNPRFGFDQGSDLWHLDPEARADEQVDRALAWLGDHRDRDAYLFLHVMDPHLFYDAPGEWRTRFVTPPEPKLDPWFNRWLILEWERAGLVDDAAKRWLVDLYDGEVAYTSHALGRLFEGLDALGGNDLVVVHTDHGEEFFEHGSFEHNHTLYDEVVRAALWLRTPDRRPGARLAEPATLADIAPTLFDLAGFDDVPPTDGRSLVPLIDGSDAGVWDRALPVAHLMYDAEQWGVVWRDKKYVITTATGEERLFDLALDPGETRDVAAEHDLGPYREALSRAHGMPVGPGWRVEIDLRGGDPLVWELPARATSAGVIDPEAGLTNRSNREWGEEPTLRAADVAAVSLSEDGRTLTVTPGSRGMGVVQVRFDAPMALGGTVRRGEVPILLGSGLGGSAWGMAPGTRLVARAGTVIEPPPDEAARMAAHGVGTASPQDLEMLRTLGYLGSD